MVALRQVDGSEEWSLTCKDIKDEDDTACADTIEAASSLSPFGLVLYYGDFFGNVKAIQIGELTVDTPVPTEFPTEVASESPTIALSEVPSLQPSSLPTGVPSSMPILKPSVSQSPSDPGTTQQPTPITSEGPTASLQCLDSCPGNEDSWETKCELDSCMGCPACSPTTAPTSAPTNAPVAGTPPPTPANSGSCRTTQSVAFYAVFVASLLALLL